MSDMTITQGSSIGYMQSASVYSAKADDESREKDMAAVTQSEEQKKALGVEAEKRVYEQQKADSAVAVNAEVEEQDDGTMSAKSEKELSEAVQKINQERQQEIANALNRQNIGLAFSIDKTYGSESTIVNVIDQNTEKTVRQIPSEDFLKLSQRVDELIAQKDISPTSKETMLKGMLLDDQA